MKKSVLFFLFILICIVGISQPISQRGTTAVTVQDARLFAQYNFRPPVFPDTTSANLQIGLDSCGALIFSRDINAYYYRACNPKRWLAISGGGGGGSYWQLSGNSDATAGSSFVGTTNNIPLEFRIKDKKSGIIDSTNKNVGFGFNTLKLNTPNGSTIGTYNVAIGHNALSKDTFGVQNVAIGGAALGTSTTKSTANVSIGYASLNQSRTPAYTVAIGWGALARDYYGYFNTAVGADVANYNAPPVGDTMVRNTLIGHASAYKKYSGRDNVFIGDSTGVENLAGSGNVFIGSKAGKNETGSNKLYIANSNTNAPLIKGDFSAQTLIMNGKMTVGGSQSPDSTLDVKGGVRFQALLPSNNASDSMLVVKSNGGIGFRSVPNVGSTPSLQQVTDVNDTTTNNIVVDYPYFYPVNTTIYPGYIRFNNGSISSQFTDQSLQFGSLSYNYAIQPSVAPTNNPHSYTLYNNKSTTTNDTIATLADIRAGGGGSGTVTSVATGYGLSGGTITTSGTLSVDTSTLSSKYVRVVDTSVFQRKSSAAYTFKANNTNATANATDQTFRDPSSQTYTGTILWNGTAPTGTTNHTYHWTQVGKKVDLRISLVYGTAGATNSQVTLAIPSDCPTPASISGLTANQDMLYQGTGYINSTTSAPTAFCRAYIRNIVASPPDIFLVQTTSISARCAWITITYWTN